VAVQLSPATSAYHPTDPYVRRFWAAALGPSAVVDLLRLSQAARRRQRVRRPLRLRSLLEAGLVRIDGESILVVEEIPPLPPRLVARLPVHLRREHASLQSAGSGGADQGEDEGG
jgi:hypothetical protein